MRKLISTFTAGAFVATAAAFAFAPTASADPETRCRSLDGGGYTCTTVTPTTTPVSTSSHSGGGSWSDKLPDLGAAFWIGLVAIAIGVIILTAFKSNSDNAHTPAAGIDAATNRNERAAGVALIGLGVLGLGWGAGGISGLVLSAFIGVPVFLIAASTGSRADHEKAGYTIAQQRYQEQVDAARAEAMHRPGQYDDLGLAIPQGPFTPPSAPTVTREEAHRMGRSNGFTVPAGSAAAKLLDPYGNDGPTRVGLDRVVQQLGWGAWANDGESRTWEPYVTLAGVTWHADGDADVRLAITHASVDDAQIEKRLPALLMAWNVNDGTVARDGAGVTIRVTNKTMKQRLQEEQQGGSDEVWDF